MWGVLSIAAIVLLVYYFNGRNSVWGGMTGGVILGLIAAIFFAFQGDGFPWVIIGKGAVIGTITGFVFDLLGMFGDRLRR